MYSPFTHTSREIIGKRIKILRQKNDMTLQQLADLLEAERQYVWSIENGKVNLTLDYIDRIAKALNVQQSEFINTNV
ncbi:MAG: helix-turn-helix transcriptional regulator [Cyclobacteriaceae bacterium]|nr:helix-turn-helix transcriptional regulator [Cyclobacteriaceae bacterium]